ncbi:MAG: transporter permease [Proteobacteria bacterium]|nr:transporter permease [Pseudomonadota bacterium]
MLAVFRRYSGVLPYALVLTLFFFGTSIYAAIWPFWGMAKYGWSGTTVGLTLAASGLTVALLQGLGTGPAVARWGERRMAMVGLAGAAATCVGFALSPTTAIVVVMLVINAVEGFAHPMLSALMSKAVPEDTQGALQGGISALMNLGMLAGAIFYSQTFGYFLSEAAPVRSADVSFFIAAAIMLVSLGLFVRQARRMGQG